MEELKPARVLVRPCPTIDQDCRRLWNDQLCPRSNRSPPERGPLWKCPPRQEGTASTRTLWTRSAWRRSCWERCRWRRRRGWTRGRGSRRRSAGAAPPPGGRAVEKSPDGTLFNLGTLTKSISSRNINGPNYETADYFRFPSIEFLVSYVCMRFRLQSPMELCRKKWKKRITGPKASPVTLLCLPEEKPSFWSYLTLRILHADSLPLKMRNKLCNFHESSSNIVRIRLSVKIMCAKLRLLDDSGNQESWAQQLIEICPSNPIFETIPSILWALNVFHRILLFVKVGSWRVSMSKSKLKSHVEPRKLGCTADLNLTKQPRAHLKQYPPVSSVSS